MVKQSESMPNRGVEYNIKITKRKHKDNIIERNSFLVGDEADASSGISDPSVLGRSDRTKSSEVISCGYPHSTPPSDLIKEEQVKTAMLQLFKNGESNYKLKLRLNLTDNTDVDFIAKLTTDRRNFRKYLPEGCEEWFVGWSDTQARAIKQQYGVRCYRGKFHLAQPFQRGKKVLTQIEPWSQCVVWYDPENKIWMTIIQTYEFALCRELSDLGINLNQSRNNLHRQDIWRNPRFDIRQRPRTWAETRMNKNE